MTNKEWYMIFATGEDGAGVSEWRDGDDRDDGVREVCAQVGWTSYQGECLIMRIELPEGVEPPDFIAWPIDPEEEGILEEEDEEDDE